MCPRDSFSFTKGANKKGADWDSSWYWEISQPRWKNPPGSWEIFSPFPKKSPRFRNKI